jgi:hypothetical protein
MAKITKLKLVPPGKRLSEVAAAVNTLNVLLLALIASVETQRPGTKHQMAMMLRRITSTFTFTSEQTAAYQEAIRILTQE